MRSRPRPNVLRRAHGVAALLALAGVATLGGACDNDALDADCTPEAPDITLNDDCPYSNGRGPQVKEASCPPVAGDPTGSADWIDVFSMLVAADRGNCSSPACHGDERTAALQIYLPSDDQTRFYQTLVNTKGTVGRPYVNPDNPADSWIYCNVRGDPGGGFPMPKPAGLPNLADAEIVRNWLLAGAPGPAQ